MYGANYSNIVGEFLKFALTRRWGSNSLRAAPEGGQCLVFCAINGFSILLSTSTGAVIL